jgi:hypothetical protein
LSKVKWTIIILILAISVAGCATKPIIDKSNGQKQVAEKQKSFFELSPSDTDILNEAFTYLSDAEGAPDYNAAKAKLGMLIQEHPKSKWAANAQILILTIDNLLALQAKVKVEKQAKDKAHADKSKLFKENESLRKEYKLLEERYQTETVKLYQENEQLKNDIALLKKLEIQLEKREKKLK